MIGSEILEVAIGLVFVFLVVSLLATTIRELIESLLKTRAIQLERGIRMLLDDPSGTNFAKPFFDHPMIFALFQGDYDPRGMLGRFWLRKPKVETKSASGQPAEQIDKRVPFASSLPNYLPSRSFALALMDLVAGSGKGGQPLTMDGVKAGAMTLPEGRLKQAMMVAIGEAEGDLERVRTSLETWYDSTMDRVAGWYKRETQGILIAIGLVLAVLLNVDTLRVLHDLSTDNTVRTTLMARIDEVYGTMQATTPAEPNPPTADAGASAREPAVPPVADSNAKTEAKPEPEAQQASGQNAGEGGEGQNAPAPAAAVSGDDAPLPTGQTGGAPVLTKEQLDQIRLGLSDVIGWPRLDKQIAAEIEEERRTLGPKFDRERKPEAIRWLSHILWSIPGWILTALAVSLGAPFWFDLLSKFMTVRSTLKPPSTGETADAEAVQKTGGAAGSRQPSALAAPPPAVSVPGVGILRLAVDPSIVTPTVSLNGGPVALPADGTIEMALPAGQPYTVTVNGTQSGAPFTTTRTFTLGLDDIECLAV